MLIKFLNGMECEIENLRGANLTGADLTRANLAGADLTRANLTGVNLTRANLTRADLPSGEKWEAYLSDVVPGLLVAGGKTIAQILEAGAWKCNSWDNCPMAEAFSTHSIDGVPLLLRPRAEQFIQFFDAHLIPEPKI